jgi:hypothetical protein
MKKISVFAFILLSLCVEANSQNFKLIKVGMKDTQVEKLVSLPMEIFKGFPEIVNYETIENRGQLNYLCWRFKKSIILIVDTVSEETTKDTSVIDKINSTFCINDIKCEAADTVNIMNDSVFTYGKPPFAMIISSSAYYAGIIYPAIKDLYHSEIVRSKNIRNDTVYISKKIITGVKKKQHRLIENYCILFDPSSNRVVDAGYYPTRFEERALRIK